ncbi:MAG: AAA family ATPase [Bacteroidales bacterium]|nr:AAA family ATPase [Bacteroidales bacterium]
MLIFLIGFMGSGKSTLGKRLAKKMSWEFMDMDNVLEEQEGMTVSKIFDEKGEAYFREAESQLLQSLDPSVNRVVATGGGAPCHKNNMELMNEKGVTVYLRMHECSLACRLEKARAVRPLIEGLQLEELRKYIRQKLDEREPFYNKAHCIIKGENVKPDHIISLVFGNSDY